MFLNYWGNFELNLTKSDKNIPKTRVPTVCESDHGGSNCRGGTYYNLYKYLYRLEYARLENSNPHESDS